MKLIDADALKENMFHYAAPEMMWDRGDIEHKINEMPTIDAIPMEWLKAQINEALDDNETELALDIDWLIRKYMNEQEGDSGCHLEMEFNLI